jgi:hypothetical protein
MTTPTRLSLVASIGLLFPSFAFAHETQHFQIGDKEYMFVVGSLNEPVAVDDKSGVELRVSLVPSDDAMATDEYDEAQPHDHETATPVTGLEQTLKVEISAADKKKMMDLSPQFGQPGAYKAVFFPTVQTTLSYRFFGTIDGTAVDLSFSCNPAGHPASPEETTETKVSDTVTRTLKKGAFGCPVAKADLGFPEPSATLQELRGLETTGGEGMDPGWIGVVSGGLGVLLGGVALMKKGHGSSGPVA